MMMVMMLFTTTTTMMMMTMMLFTTMMMMTTTMMMTLPNAGVASGEGGGAGPAGAVRLEAPPLRGPHGQDTEPRVRIIIIIIIIITTTTTTSPYACSSTASLLPSSSFHKLSRQSPSPLREAVLTVRLRQLRPFLPAVPRQVPAAAGAGAGAGVPPRGRLLDDDDDHDHDHDDHDDHDDDSHFVRYDRFYQPFLDKYRQRRVRVLELGCRLGGVSFWAELLPAAEIVCVDIAFKKTCKPWCVRRQKRRSS
jgi:hypothetical protein